jgi:hypothetical protein
VSNQISFFFVSIQKGRETRTRRKEDVEVSMGLPFFGFFVSSKFIGGGAKK